jgi:hypothetical protein
MLARAAKIHVYMAVHLTMIQGSSTNDFTKVLAKIHLLGSPCISNWNLITDTMFSVAWPRIQTVSILFVSSHALLALIIFWQLITFAGKSTLSNHIFPLSQIKWLNFCCWYSCGQDFWSFYFCPGPCLFFTPILE